MLTKIVVRDSPTFSSIDIRLSKGLNVISGVSGSGKSVFLESILALLGIKDSNASLIEAELEVDFDAMGVNPGDYGMSIKKGKTHSMKILKKRKTRYFLDDQAMPKGKVQSLMASCGKYISNKDCLELTSPYMIGILDSMIQSINPEYISTLNEYKVIYKEFKDTEKSLDKLTKIHLNIDSISEDLKFEIDRITRLDPSVGEYEELLELKRNISKKEKILQSAQLALDCIDSTDVVIKALKLINCDPSQFESAITEARDSIVRATEKLEHLNLDPGKLLDRIGELSEINRLYGSVEKALEHIEEQRVKLTEYENIEITIEEASKRFSALNDKVNRMAEEIYSFRESNILCFSDRLSCFGEILGLNKVEVNLSRTEPGLSGIGTLHLTLNKVPVPNISSGEFNRLRLSVLCLSAEISNTDGGMLILDEIDANLSGEESEGVAKLLKFLSSSYQIFAISHQPHMPILSDNHYLVQKNDDGTSSVSLLDYDGRVSEIARMVGGSNPSEDAINFARNRLAEVFKKDATTNSIDMGVDFLKISENNLRSSKKKWFSNRPKFIKQRAKKSSSRNGGDPGLWG